LRSAGRMRRFQRTRWCRSGSRSRKRRYSSDSRVKRAQGPSHRRSTFNAEDAGRRGPRIAARMTRVSHRVTWADNSRRFIANDWIRWPTAIIDQRKDCRCSRYCTGPSPPWSYFSARPPHHPSRWPIAGAVRLKNVWLPVKRPAARTAAFTATRRSGTRRYQRSASSQRSADISGTRAEGLEVPQ